MTFFCWISNTCKLVLYLTMQALLLSLSQQSNNSKTALLESRNCIFSPWMHSTGCITSTSVVLSNAKLGQMGLPFYKWVQWTCFLKKIAWRWLEDWKISCFNAWKILAKHALLESSFSIFRTWTNSFCVFPIQLNFNILMRSNPSLSTVIYK